MNIPHIPAGEKSFDFTLICSEFRALQGLGLVIDGRSGGLIKGRSLRDGGILVAFRFRDEYVVQAKTQGGEFVMSRSATNAHIARLFALRRSWEPSSEVISDVVPVLDMSAQSGDQPLLLVELGQEFMQRRITTKHLGELVRLNRAS